MSLETTLLFVPGLLAGITAHECAHAWSASRLGDGYSRRQGRVSLNPLRHLSPLGTLAMFLLPFGWGKPVYVNLYNFRHPRRDYLLTSLAGPLANVVLVAVCIALMQLTRHTFAYGPAAAPFMVIAHVLFLLAAIANTILAAFNLIPIPPLDGSKIWPCIFRRVKPSFSPSTRRLTFVILIVLLSSRALDPAIRGVVKAVQEIMPAQDAEVFRGRALAAQAALRSGRYAEAEKALDDALAVNPQSAVCFYLRASARAAQKRWPAAAEDIRRALELEKGNRTYQEAQAAIERNLSHPQ